MSFRKLFSSVILAVLLSSQVLGLPFGGLQGNSTNLLSHYDPEVLYETYGEGVEHPLSGLVKRSVEETAVSFVVHKLGVGNDQVVYRAGFSSDITDHAYLNQVHDGIPFVNAVANVAMQGGKVVAFGSSFAKFDKISSSQPTVDEKTAIATAQAALDCTYDLHPTSLQYLANPDKSASLVYVIQVRNDDAGKFYQAHVDAHSGKLLSTVNFVSAATYTAVPIHSNSVLNGQVVLINPQDTMASPIGWHRDNLQVYTVTRGNNGFAYRASDQHFANETSSATYAYRYDTSLDPTAGGNADAAIVNAFYLLGIVHDITYRYGFTESAFNFQQTNFKNGGRGNDGVIVSVNDRSQNNNAFFYTPPDGQPGTCKLHMFLYTQPARAGAMDNPLVVHEFGHGVSNRLVGGGSASCLTTLESQSLGEGWSDVLADWTQQSSANTKDFIFASYAIPANVNPNGFRKYPYSTDIRRNPLMYSDTTILNEVHDLGAIFANMLHNVYAQLVATYGYSSDAMTNPSGTGGNVIFMHLFLDAFPLLPCRPTFIAARNGFLQADVNRYRSQHLCLLWRVFASRGLGYNARGYANNFDLPAGC